MKVTEIQKKILLDVAEGIGRAETAQKNGKAIRTIERHLEIMRARMGAKTAAHLIHLAHQNKILD